MACATSWSIFRRAILSRISCKIRALFRPLTNELHVVSPDFVFASERKTKAAKKDIHKSQPRECLLIFMIQQTQHFCLFIWSWHVQVILFFSAHCTNRLCFCCCFTTVAGAGGKWSADASVWSQDFHEHLLICWWLWQGQCFQLAFHSINQFVVCRETPRPQIRAH